MKVISIINLKGGVGKTVTTVNMAGILSSEYNKRVLVIDADPQANASRFLRTVAEYDCGLAGMLEGFITCWDECVSETNIQGVDIVSADLSLLNMDVAAVQADASIVKRMGDFIDNIREDDAYDYVLIDCPPGFTGVSIAGIATSDEVIIPAKIDAFAMDGIAELTAQIDAVKRANKRIRLAGILVTMWHNAPAVTQGEQFLRSTNLPVFETYIRRSDKVDESTFVRAHLTKYSRYCSAARDYRDFVDEYLDKEGERNG